MAKCVADDRSRNADRTLTSGRRWTRYHYSHHLSPVTTNQGNRGTGYTGIRVIGHKSESVVPLFVLHCTTCSSEYIKRRGDQGHTH